MIYIIQTNNDNENIKKNIWNLYRRKMEMGEKDFSPTHIFNTKIEMRSIRIPIGH